MFGKVLGFEVTAVFSRYLSRQVETETGPAVLRRAKRFEEMRQDVERNRGAVVRDLGPAEQKGPCEGALRARSTPGVHPGPSPATLALRQPMTTTATAAGGVAGGIPTDLLTPAQVASALGIAKTGLYGLLARGHIPFQRVGRLIRLREGDVAGYLTRTRTEARPPRTYVRLPA